MKKIISRLNWHEAIFDIVLILYVFFFLRSPEGYLHESSDYWGFILGGWIAVFTIFWYFGIIIRILRTRPHHKIMVSIVAVA